MQRTALRARRRCRALCVHPSDNNDVTTSLPAGVLKTRSGLYTFLQIFLRRRHDPDARFSRCAGDYVWVLTPVKGGADVRSVGRYDTIWHRQSDGSWKVTRLIWNSSEPAPRS